MRFLPCFFMLACTPLPAGVEQVTEVSDQSLLTFGAGSLYGADKSGLWRTAPTANSKRETLITKETFYDLSIDLDRLLFTQSNDGANATTVRRALLDGTGVVDIGTNAKGGSLRQDAKYLYWIDGTTPTGATIMRAPKAGNEPPFKVADAGLILAPEIAVDDAFVFWLDSTAPQSIKRVPKGGGATVVFLSDISPQLLTSNGTELLFLDGQDGVNSIFVVDKVSGEKKELVKGVNKFWLDESYVYYTSYSGGKNMSQSMKRIDRVSGKTDILLGSVGSLSLLQMAFDPTYFYWADGRTVQRLAKPVVPQ